MPMKFNLSKPNSKFLTFASIRTYIIFSFYEKIKSQSTVTVKNWLFVSHPVFWYVVFYNVAERGVGSRTREQGGGLEQLFDYLRGYICYSDKKGKKRKTVSEEGTEWALS